MNQKTVGDQIKAILGSLQGELSNLGHSARGIDHIISSLEILGEACSHIPNTIAKARECGREGFTWQETWDRLGLPEGQSLLHFQEWNKGRKDTGGSFRMVGVQVLFDTDSHTGARAVFSSLL